METGRSDTRVATLVAASKASGINILEHWLPGLPLVLPSFNALGTAGRFAHMAVRGCSIQISSIRRHANSKLHRLATEALQKGDCIRSLVAPAAKTCQELLERLRTGGLEQTWRGDR